MLLKSAVDIFKMYTRHKYSYIALTAQNCIVQNETHDNSAWNYLCNHEA